jgi:hypothetical protein
MTVEEAVAALDALNASDAEVAHSAVDDILLELVPPEVKAAYDRLVARAPWWACA